MPAEGALRDGDGPGFELIETLRWEPAARFVRLDRHLARLYASAAALGFHADPQKIGAALHDPHTNEWRAVMGGVNGPPYLLKNTQPTDEAIAAAGVGDDAYSRRLHAVALKRAVAQIVQ